MSHLDHLLQLPWAFFRRAPPTEVTRSWQNSSEDQVAALAVISRQGSLTVQ